MMKNKEAEDDITTLTLPDEPLNSVISSDYALAMIIPVIFLYHAYSDISIHKTSNNRYWRSK
jgi:hypothetical protein